MTHDPSREDSDPLRPLWALDPAIAFLNHGSFGACPVAVLEAASELRARIEREPVRFFVLELEPRLDEARAAVAAFLGADPDDLAFVPNATAGVSTVLRSIDLRPGDELLTTDHAYNACRNALEHAAAGAGARVTVAEVPFPTPGPDAVVAAVLAAVTPRTRLALLDHASTRPHRARLPRRAPGAREPRGAGHRRARRRRARPPGWSRWISARPPLPTRRGTSTSGPARRRARRSSTCDAIGRR